MTAGSRARNSAANRARVQGHGQRREQPGPPRRPRRPAPPGPRRRSARTEAGRRIEARQLPEDHPASRRTPATPPAIRHQAKHPGPRSARPGEQQARRQVEPPGPRNHRAALLFAGYQHDQDDHGHQEPGRRIEARHLPEDHPARTRRTPATPPAIRHQARHQVKHPGPRSARPGEQQARHQMEPPGPRITRPPCSLPTTSTTRATTATGSPAAIRTGCDQQNHADDGRQQGQERRSEPDQGTGPRAKKRTARARTADRATSTTRSPAAGSRPGTCRRITRQAPGGAAAGHHLADSRPGTRLHTTRAADHPATLLFANDQHDQGDHDHREPGGDPHGRKPAGPRRRRPAAGPGAAQRTRPGHRATAKKETGRTATATPTTSTTRSPDTGSRPRSCRRITRQPPGEHRQRLRRSGSRPGTRWSTPGGDRHDLADSRPGARWNQPGPRITRPPARPGSPRPHRRARPPRQRSARAAASRTAPTTTGGRARNGAANRAVFEATSQ